MKLLVVGANGYIGKALVKCANEFELQVIKLTSQQNGQIDGKAGTLLESFSFPLNVETIIYLSQSPFYRNVSDHISHMLKINQCLAIELAEIAKRSGVKNFIYLSTGTVYKPSYNALSENDILQRDNWYSLSKIHAEESLKLFEQYMDVKIIRLFGVYGQNQMDKLIPNIINKIITGGTITVQTNSDDINDIDGLRISFCYIDDLINIIFQLMRIDGSICVNVGGDESVSIRQIVGAVSSILHCDQHIKIVEPPRNGDLISDNSFLYSTLPSLSFMPFSEGIQHVVESVLSK